MDLKSLRKQTNRRKQYCCAKPADSVKKTQDFHQTADADATQLDSWGRVGRRRCVLA